MKKVTISWAQLCTSDGRDHLRKHWLNVDSDYVIGDTQRGVIFVTTMTDEEVVTANAAEADDLFAFEKECGEKYRAQERWERERNDEAYRYKMEMEAAERNQ